MVGPWLGRILWKLTGTIQKVLQECVALSCRCRVLCSDRQMQHSFNILLSWRYDPQQKLALNLVVFSKNYNSYSLFVSLTIFLSWCWQRRRSLQFCALKKIFFFVLGYGPRLLNDTQITDHQITAPPINISQFAPWPTFEHAQQTGRYRYFYGFVCNLTDLTPVSVKI